MKKLLSGHGQNWVLPIWSQDCKIDCISKMNRCIKLFFTCWYKFRKANWFNDFWVGVVKKWLWPLNSRDPEICCILKINLWIEPILECFRLISYSLTFKIWGSTVVVLLAISQINCILYLFFSCKVFEAFAVLVLNFIFVNLLNSWVTINLVVSIYQHLQSFL